MCPNAAGRPRTGCAGPGGFSAEAAPRRSRSGPLRVRLRVGRPGLSGVPCCAARVVRVKPEGRGVVLVEVRRVGSVPSRTPTNRAQLHACAFLKPFLKVKREEVCSKCQDSFQEKPTVVQRPGLRGTSGAARPRQPLPTPARKPGRPLLSQPPWDKGGLRNWVRARTRGFPEKDPATPLSLLGRVRMTFLFQGEELGGIQRT